MQLFVLAQTIRLWSWSHSTWAKLLQCWIYHGQGWQVSISPVFQIIGTFWQFSSFRFIIKDRETFFSSAQRSQLVWQILMRTGYDDENKEKVGITRLLSNRTYSAAYPLHDGLHNSDDGNHSSKLSSRRVSEKKRSDLPTAAKRGIFPIYNALWGSNPRPLDLEPRAVNLAPLRHYFSTLIAIWSTRSNHPRRRCTTRTPS